MAAVIISLAFQLSDNSLQQKEKILVSPLKTPPRTPRALPNLSNPAIFANLFRPKRFPQASENRAAGIRARDRCKPTRLADLVMFVQSEFSPLGPKRIRYGNRGRQRFVGD